MSDPMKMPFDSIPLDGATADPPRPSFSRSVPDAVTSVGLLPPTRKPVAVAVPEPTPPASTEPNPMASTPPPQPGSLRGLMWDMVRPTRTKGAILAGGLSLIAGAYGLNLFVPSGLPTEPTKRKLPETAKLTDVGPRVHVERPPGPGIQEERITPTTVMPGSDPKEKILPVGGQTAADPLKPEPLPALPPAIPSNKVDPLPVPVVAVANDKPSPGGPITLPPSLPVEQPRTALPPAPISTPPSESSVTLPKPVMPLKETPEPKKADPLPTPVDLNPLPVVPVADTKPLPPPMGTGLPPVVLTPEKPIEAAPLPKPVNLGAPLPNPTAIDVKPIDPVTPKVESLPIPPPVKLDSTPVKPEPIPVPTPFVEEKPTPIGMPVAGIKEVSPIAPPPALTVKDVPLTAVPPVAVAPSEALKDAPPAKKGFEVDVVKVKPTDTYGGISEAFYQSKKYAAALRAFNDNKDIGQLQEVEVPPLHELQKVTPTPAPLRGSEPTDSGRGIIPARGTGPAPVVSGPVFDLPVGDAGESADWGPAGKRRPVIKYEKFTTPKDGMTPRDVARAVYDDESQWSKLLGPRGGRVRGDEAFPRGTELTVPREVPQWK
ncbi:MAG: hypothetical protein MUF18_11225 [Fimbriiglobus sp.]|nr:hypothetical protein [Fimbriiglobus sp.]